MTKQEIPENMKWRHELSKYCMEKGMSVYTFTEILENSGMEGKSDPEKEAIAKRLVEELQAEE